MLNAMDLEWCIPNKDPHDVVRYYIQISTKPTGKGWDPWKDSVCDMNYRGGSSNLEQASAVLGHLQAREREYQIRYRGREVEEHRYRLVRRTASISTEVVE